MNGRIHGRAPVRIVCLHGGPGGIGSALGLAEGLASVTGAGVLEPFQSAGTVAGQVEELAEQTSGISEPFDLAGHSWGAWLAGLFAAAHPERVNRLALLGGGPLRPPGSAIDDLRKSRFSPSEAAEYERLLSELSSGRGDADLLLKKLGELCERADTFEDAGIPEPPPDAFDALQFKSVWSEADAMRKSGELERIFASLRTPAAIFHGDADPHPADGISAVLAEHGIHAEYHLLRRCGHTPWREKYARTEFFRLLADWFRK